METTSNWRRVNKYFARTIREKENPYSNRAERHHHKRGTCWYPSPEPRKGEEGKATESDKWSSNSTEKWTKESFKHKEKYTDGHLVDRTIVGNENRLGVDVLIKRIDGLH